MDVNADMQRLFKFYLGDMNTEYYTEEHLPFIILPVVAGRQLLMLLKIFTKIKLVGEAQLLSYFSHR